MITENKKTITDLRYKEIHIELIGLKLYDLADTLSAVYWGKATESFSRGMETAERIINTKN
tara:strand:- start:18 stop:200 length:183 start_codon:yes stop_codon:yes gene_type:complete